MTRSSWDELTNFSRASRKEKEAAYDHLQNLREQELEYAKKLNKVDDFEAETTKPEMSKLFAKGGAVMRKKADIERDQREMGYAATYRKGGKVRKFDEGGDTSDKMLADTYSEPEEEPKHAVAERAPAKKQSFSEAFREARAAGDKTFEWNGKKYGTELAKPAAKPKFSPPVERQFTSMGGRGLKEQLKSAMDTKPRTYKKGGAIHMKEMMGPRNMHEDVEGGKKAKHLKHGEHSEQHRGHTRDLMEKMHNGKLDTIGDTNPSKMKKGGKVHKYAAGGHVGRGDGIVKKGHTKGKVC
jgi:hypothetical protein